MAKTEIIPQANELCRISKGTRITGVMTSTADIRIDGTFDGTVYTKGKLVVGEAANIKGRIFAQSCDIWGHVEGDIFIEDIVNFKANSNFSGSLKTRLQRLLPHHHQGGVQQVSPRDSRTQQGCRS